MATWQVPGTKIRFKDSENRVPSEIDWGEGWHFNHRSIPEWLQMHPTAVRVEGEDTDAVERQRDADLEVFGDTLDDPIPEDLAEILLG